MPCMVAMCQKVALLLLVVGTICNCDDTCNSKTHNSHQDVSGEDVNEFFQSKVKVEIKDSSAELQSKLEAQETRLQAAEQELRESKQQLQEAKQQLRESNARMDKLEGMVLGLLGKESQPDSATDTQLDELQDISKVEPSATGNVSVSHLNASVTRINITAASSVKFEDCRSLLSKRSGKVLILKAIEDWVNTAIDKASSGIKKIIEAGLSGLKTIINTVEDAAKKSLDSATSWLSGVIDTVKSAANSALDALKPSNLWSALKPFVSQVTDPVTNTIKKAFNSVKKFALSGINFFQGLYDKYLKPIINHIGRCASKGSVPNFIFCMIEPVVNQIFKYLMPAGDIAKEVPFADEQVENIWDFDMERYVQTKRCRDCNGDDPRDRAPSACREEERDVGIGSLTLKVCDAPFGMDKDKEIEDEIKESLWACNKKASVFREGTVWANIFDTLESARPALFTAETITASGLDKARNLKTLMTSNPQMSQAEALITQFKQTMDTASDNCMKAKDASTVLMAHLIRVLEKFNFVAGQFTKMMGLAESCQEDLLIGYNLLSQMELSADTAVQGVSAHLKSNFTQTEQTLKAMIVLLNEASDSISGDMQDSIEERMRTVATPTLEDLKNLPRNCAIGKGPYMKMYTSFKGNNPITGMGEILRMSLHQRTGFKIAWRDFKNLKKGFVIKSVSYTWEQLREATKQSDDVKVEFCFIFFCVHITFRLRNKFTDLMGIPMPSLIKNIDMGDETYFFTLEVSVFELTLEKIGIPVELQIPVSQYVPEMTVPFIVTIPEPTTPPALPSVVEQETELSEGATAALSSMEEEQNVATQQKEGNLEVENLCAAEDADRTQITQANSELSPDLTDDDFQTPLKNLGGSAHTSGTLNLCEGDCDSDSHCLDGLVCFQRDKGDAVPGCSGSDDTQTDYCIQEPDLNNLGGSAHTSGTLNLCEGDCDDDSHCKSGLVCFQRDEGDAVPGCSGSDDTGTDYCIQEPELKNLGGSAHTSGTLNLCEGDCDVDSHCGSGLVCFQRDGGDAIPGCSGSDGGSTDYCIQEPDLKNLGGSAHTSGTLNLCEGDCDSDSHCESGLVCLQRDGGDAVPGCRGSDDSQTDYCIQEPELKHHGMNAHTSGTLNLCEGDCDVDSHCKSGLVCFQRDEGDAIPGCSGSDDTGTDYCIREPELKNLGGSAHTSGLLNLCEGDCDSDSHCDADLMCFQRDGGDAVPGCSGSDTSQTDYCIQKPELKNLGGSAHTSGLLKLCEGDCDSDSHCESRYVCFQRGGGDAVPGCSGSDDSQTDYCIPR